MADTEFEEVLCLRKNRTYDVRYDQEVICNDFFLINNYLSVEDFWDAWNKVLDKDSFEGGLVLGFENGPASFDLDFFLELEEEVLVEEHEIAFEDGVVDSEEVKDFVRAAMDYFTEGRARVFVNLFGFKGMGFRVCFAYFESGKIVDCTLQFSRWDAQKREEEKVASSLQQDEVGC